jgi:hypothetical protein
MPAWDLPAIQFSRIVFFLFCKLITLFPASALLLILLILLAAPTQTQAQQLSATAVQQIQILLQEKANRTPAQKKSALSFYRPLNSIEMVTAVKIRHPHYPASR